MRICTGTGIGAALSTCLQSPNWFLIWIGSDQEKTFGPTISGLIHRHIGPERLLLWDSKLRGGRPDTMKILKEVCRPETRSQQASDALEGILRLERRG